MERIRADKPGGFCTSHNNQKKMFFFGVGKKELTGLNADFHSAFLEKSWRKTRNSGFQTKFFSRCFFAQFARHIARQQIAV